MLMWLSSTEYSSGGEWVAFEHDAPITMLKDRTLTNPSSISGLNLKFQGGVWVRNEL